MLQRRLFAAAVTPKASTVSSLTALAVAASRRSFMFAPSGTRLSSSSSSAAEEGGAAATETDATSGAAAAASEATIAAAAERAAQFEREAALRSAEDASRKNAEMLEKAAMLRREIHEIWAHPEDTWEEQQSIVAAAEAERKRIAVEKGLVTAAEAEGSAPIFGKMPTAAPMLTRYEKQAVLARALLDKHRDIFNVAVPRDQDVTRALGEAFDRLLLMQVPLPDNGASTTHLQTVLDMAGKNGKELSVKVVQHLFSRCACYPEAIALLYAMRYANVNMSVDCYYAMIFSLQRLDEEAWCLRYREEAAEKRKQNNGLDSSNNADNKSDSKLSSSSHLPTAGPDAGKKGSFPLSAKALDFVVFGSDNQLLPENKPWVGRGIFTAEDEHATPTASKRNTTRDFDAMGAQWLRRLRDGQAIVNTKRNGAAAGSDAV